MLSYCLKCRKNRESKHPKVVKTKYGRIILLSKFSVCNSKKLRSFKEQEAIQFLSKLTGTKIPVLSDLPIINTLF